MCQLATVNGEARGQVTKTVVLNRNCVCGVNIVENSAKFNDKLKELSRKNCLLTEMRIFIVAQKTNCKRYHAH